MQSMAFLITCPLVIVPVLLFIPLLRVLLPILFSRCGVLLQLRLRLRLQVVHLLLLLEVKLWRGAGRGCGLVWVDKLFEAALHAGFAVVHARNVEVLQSSGHDLGRAVVSVGLGP